MPELLPKYRLAAVQSPPVPEDILDVKSSLPTGDPEQEYLSVLISRPSPPLIHF